MHKYFWLLLTLLASTSSAQTFDSGSNGSFGPITLAEGENRVIDLPPDGIIHATTVTLGNFSRLSFRPNPRNTPVYLLATGDIRLGASSVISVRPGCAGPDGIYPGGPGGFSGGRSPVGDLLPGAGQGPGGGVGGQAGAHRTTSANGGNTSVYGSDLLMPLVGGSGGSGGAGNANGFEPASGWGGGGAILIATSATLETIGGAASISANSAIQDINGQDCPGGQSFFPARGAGGSVRLMATSVNFRWLLSMDVQGGLIGSPLGGLLYGGAGRCRLDALNRGGNMLIGCIDHPNFPVRSLMQVFPPGAPRLDVTNVAGTAVPLDGGPVEVTLPSTAPAVQPVTIRAEGFSGTVPIRLRLTPEHGPPVTLDGEIVMSGATGTVTLTPSFPPDVKTFVQVWTR